MTMTTDRDGPRSNPYHPNPEKCCEQCCFGHGKHADWCPRSGATFVRCVPGVMYEYNPLNGIPIDRPIQRNSPPCR